MKIVNLEEAKKEFIKYADNYDLTVEMIELKKYHSLRVMEISTKIAQKENFTEEEIELATLIGLLHDISRFKQYTEYQTYNDMMSFDHGDVAAQILEQDNYLRKFIQTDKYDEIIKKAVINHNKFAIEEGLAEEENKFCKLVRDADKIDIFYLAAGDLWKNEKEEMENSKLSPDIKKEFDEKKSILYKNHVQISYADKIIQFLAFVYDLNYKASFKLIEENNYVEKMINQFDFKDEYTKKEIEAYLVETKQYISKKLKE